MRSWKDSANASDVTIMKVLKLPATSKRFFDVPDLAFFKLRRAKGGVSPRKIFPAKLSIPVNIPP